MATALYEDYPLAGPREFERNYDPGGPRADHGYIGL